MIPAEVHSIARTFAGPKARELLARREQVVEVVTREDQVIEELRERSAQE